jgi:hypothetical protein
MDPGPARLRAVRGVDRIDAGRLDPHDEVTGPRLRRRDVAGLERFRPTRLMDDQRAHAPPYPVRHRTTGPWPEMRRAG